MEKPRIKLDELKKESPFKVPERYFVELPSEIQVKVTADQKPQPSWVVQPTFRWAAMAASVLVLAVYFSVFYTNTDDLNEAESLIAQVEMEDLIAYIETSEITTDDLISGVNLEGVYFDDLESEEMLLEDIEINELESIDLMEAIDVSTELL